MLSVGIGVGVSYGAIVGASGGPASYAGLVSANADGFTIQDDDATAVGWGTAQNVDANGVPQNNYGRTDLIRVRRAGFSAVEVAANPVDDLVVMSRFRQRYANEGLWEAASGGEVKSALSDFFYSTCSIYDANGDLGNITNNSTRAAPLPIATWLNASYTRVSAATADTIYLYVDHAHARSGQTVAGVRITLDDGTTSIQVSSNTMTTRACPKSGLTIPCFSFSPDWSSLGTDRIVTIDAEIYPYVGAKYQASVDGSNTTHTQNFGVLRVWNTSTTIRYAYVDPTSPSGTPTTSTTAATAAADPYASILLAAQALATAAGGTCDNAVIRLVEDTHTSEDFSGVAVSDAGIVIEGAPGTTLANVIVRSEAINDTNMLSDIVHWKDLTIDRTDSTTNSGMGCNATKGGKFYQCLTNITFTLTGAGVRSNNMWRQAGVVTVIDCDGADLGLARASVFTEISMFGCSGELIIPDTNPFGLFHMLGNTHASGNFRWSDDNASATVHVKVGICVAFNKFHAGATTNAILEVSEAVGVRGHSFSGNVLESFGTHSTQTLFVNADSNEKATQNVVVHQFTFVGDDANSAGRVNWLYSPITTATDVQKSGYMRNGIVCHINTKADVFGTDGTKTGNEAAFLRVGHRNLMILDTSAGGDFFKPGVWMGEVRPLNTTDGQAGFQNPGFTDDGSHAGDDAGYGNYTPTIANMASDLVPANDVAFPCDLFGSSWAIDGTDAKGAVKAA